MIRLKEAWTLDPSLVLWLPLRDMPDGNSLQSCDKHGHTCTVTGATWGAQGRSFDGTDDLLSVAYNSAFALGANDFSLSFWLFRNTNSSGRDVIGSRDNAAHTEGWILSFNIAANLLLTYISSAGAGWDIVAGGFNESFADKTWLFLEMKRSGATLTLYQNRIANAAPVTVGTTAIHDSGHSIFLGACGDGTRLWKGRLDDVRLYKRPLWPAESDRIYESTKGRYA